MINLSTSVVVPAYNCENTIANVIEALLNQTIKPNEIIIVDDGSSDGTAEKIKSYNEVTYVKQENAGPATARNNGARNSSSGIIFFTDSDCLAQKDWIEKSIQHFKDETVGVVSGSYGIANPKNILARCIHDEILFRHTKLMPTYPKSFGSYNFAIRKKVFDDINGFNEQYRFASGEDNDLSYKVLKSGFKIYFEKLSLVDHFHTEKVGKYLKEQHRHGFWRVKMYAAHPDMMSGDDYTFWKDICEIPLCGLLLLSGLTAFFLPPAILVCLTLAVLLVLLQLAFGFKIAQNPKDAIFFAYVMFLRGFTRLLGFLSGILASFGRK